MSNTCGTTLAASASCQVTGTYQATVVNPVMVGVTLSYTEGSGAPLQTSATVKKKFAYVVSYGNNTISLCTVDPNTDQLSNCEDSGGTGLALLTSFSMRLGREPM
jgi:hypothetical protein